MDAYEFHSPYPTVSFAIMQDLSVVVDFLKGAAGMVPIAPQLSAGGCSDLAAIPWRPSSQNKDREFTSWVQNKHFT